MRPLAYGSPAPSARHPTQGVEGPTERTNMVRWMLGFFRDKEVITIIGNKIVFVSHNALRFEQVEGS